jgi:hypothetical protein
MQHFRTKPGADAGFGSEAVGRAARCFPLSRAADTRDRVVAEERKDFFFGHAEGVLLARQKKQKTFYIRRLHI